MCIGHVFANDGNNNNLTNKRCSQRLFSLCVDDRRSMVKISIHVARRNHPKHKINMHNFVSLIRQCVLCEQVEQHVTLVNLAQNHIY